MPISPWRSPTTAAGCRASATTCAKGPTTPSSATPRPWPASRPSLRPRSPPRAGASICRRAGNRRSDGSSGRSAKNSERMSRRPPVVRHRDRTQATGESRPMSPTITAFKASPDRGRGLARDMRVRWAFEEVGQPYDVRLVTFEEMKAPGHLALNPFGQIPTYEEGDLALFESGAIVLRIAERHGGLLPDDANARARAIARMFAALNTVEPLIVERSMATLVERDRPWFEARQTMLDDRVRGRLSQLSARLGDADWLDGDFSAGDLMMVHAL